MSKIQLDPFWDGKTGGGVRCSSVGEDANIYHDPAEHHFEGNNGRSIASLLPSSRGLRGVVIPRATALGGSRGFDPHKPRLVNIDPDIKGQACVVDLSQITPDKMQEAYKEAAENPLLQSDHRLLAAQTFHNLAVSYEPVGMEKQRTPMLDRRSPLGDGAYVVPRSTPSGKQLSEDKQTIPMTNIEKKAEIMSPSVSPRYVAKQKAMPNEFKQMVEPKEIDWEEYESIRLANFEEESKELREDRNKQFDDYMKAKGIFKDQSVNKQVKTTVKPLKEIKPSITSAPATKVIFETEGWGQFTAYYHEVIKNDCLLVLVYDTRYKAGMQFWPPATEKLMAVKIEDQAEIFFVNSYNSKFKHADYEYCILIIEQSNEDY